MIHNPTTYNNTDWVRPSDWLPIDHLVVNGAQKLAGLYAIFPTGTPGFTSTVSFRCGGGTIVDWGDGTINNYATNITASHTYDYDTLSNLTLCSRGYKQVIIHITPQVGQNITSIDFGYTPTLTTFHQVNWLDIKVSGTLITSCRFAATYTPYPTLLEKFVFYQTSTSLISMNYMLYFCFNLQYCDISNLNTSNVTTLAYAFYITSKLKKIIGIETLNVGKVTDLTATFYLSGIENLDLSLWSSNAGVSLTLNSFVYQTGNLKLLKFGAIRVYTLINMINIDTNLQTLDLTNIVWDIRNTTYATLANRQFYRCFYFTKSLSTISGLGNVNCSQIRYIDNMFDACNIEDVTFATGNFLNLEPMIASANLFTTAYRITKIRMPLMKQTFSIQDTELDGVNCNLLFGDLVDLTNAINSMTIATAGTGYSINDIITITTGSGTANIRVLTIGAGGTVLTWRWETSIGTGYSTGTNIATTSATGINFTVNIVSLMATQTITITGTPAATDIITDRTIATAKNWTVVG